MHRVRRRRNRRRGRHGSNRAPTAPVRRRGGTRSRRRARSPAASATIAATSEPVSMVEIGTATTPLRMQPRIQAIISGESFITITTRWSRTTPMSASARWTRHTRRCTAPYDTSWPRYRTATLSANPVAMLRSSSQLAALYVSMSCPRPGLPTAVRIRSRPVWRGCRWTVERPSPPPCPVRAHRPSTTDELGVTARRQPAVDVRLPLGLAHEPSVRAHARSAERPHVAVETHVRQRQGLAHSGEGAVPPVDALLAVGDVVVAQRLVERRQLRRPRGW